MNKNVPTIVTTPFSMTDNFGEEVKEGEKVLHMPGSGALRLDCFDHPVELDGVTYIPVGSDRQPHPLVETVRTPAQRGAVMMIFTSDEFDFACGNPLTGEVDTYTGPFAVSWFDKTGKYRMTYIDREGKARYSEPPLVGTNPG